MIIKYDIGIVVLTWRVRVTEKMMAKKICNLTLIYSNLTISLERMNWAVCHLIVHQQRIRIIRIIRIRIRIRIRI